jgi:hypothetical protein
LGLVPAATLQDFCGSGADSGALDDVRNAGSFVWFVGVAGGVYVNTLPAWARKLPALADNPSGLPIPLALRLGEAFSMAVLQKLRKQV